MDTARTRRALVALVTAAALLPAAPALAQTVTPVPAPTGTQAPAPDTPQLRVDSTLVDFGETHRLTVTGAAGAAVRLFGNGGLIRTATIPASGQVTWELQPGDRTLFSAEVDGRRTASATVEVRRTVSIGVRQETRGVYTFTGRIQRAEPGVQVTIARLDSETGRVTGVASTSTTADGRYEIRTSLPVGFAGYYALTGVNSSLLQPGRSRLYGLIVNTRPGTGGPAAQGLTLGVRRAGSAYVFAGALTPARGGVPVTLARIVDGRLQGVAGGTTSADGGYTFTMTPAPGTHFFTVLTAGARSRDYGLVVPAAAPGASCSATAPLTSYEDTARCLFSAFVRDDRRLAANYATPAAVTELLSWRGTGTPGWTWSGCGAPILLQPSSGVSCTWYDPPRASEVHGVTVEFGMSRDLRVEEVGSVG